MIIGLTGSYAAGKDTAADYLKTKGFVFYSLSDILRDELRKTGKSLTRENLIELGNTIRKDSGPGELARRVLEKIAESEEENFVVVSIRNPQEVNVLRDHPDFVLWYVDAPVKMRYERSVRRGRSDDFSSFEKFAKFEQVENSSDPSAQQLQKVAEMADHKIVNDKDIQSFKRVIDEFLEEPV